MQAPALVLAGLMAGVGSLAAAECGGVFPNDRFGCRIMSWILLAAAFLFIGVA